MKISVLVFLLFCICSFDLWSQRSFGVELGTYFHNYQGVNDFDSIRVITNDQDRGELFAGVFYEFGVFKKIKLQNKLYFKPVYVDYVVLNTEEQCQFCPIQKGKVSQIANISIESLALLPVINLGSVKLNIQAGINVGFNISNRQDDISFNGRHEGVARVINELDRSPRPLTLGLISGASMEFRRFILAVNYQYSTPYSRSLSFGADNYDFRNTWSFLNLSLGYKLLQVP